MLEFNFDGKHNHNTRDCLEITNSYFKGTKNNLFYFSPFALKIIRYMVFY